MLHLFFKLFREIQFLIFFDLQLPMVTGGEVGMCLTQKDPWETFVRQIGPLFFKDSSSATFSILILYLQSLICVCSIASCTGPTGRVLSATTPALLVTQQTLASGLRAMTMWLTRWLCWTR